MSGPRQMSGSWPPDQNYTGGSDSHIHVLTSLLGSSNPRPRSANTLRVYFICLFVAALGGLSVLSSRRPGVDRQMVLSAEKIFFACALSEAIAYGTSYTSFASCVDIDNSQVFRFFYLDIRSGISPDTVTSTNPWLLDRRF
jgi:hypothetical protein